MARKRMISPEIWASSSFAELSDFAKIVFIGLISNADDEGKGEADPALLKSTLFPRDEKKRAADVKSALSEIARSTSTLFYSVEGKNYYVLIKWKVYQKLDRPTPSKIPNPPNEQSVGERGSYMQNHDFDEGSTNTRRILDEGSPLIEQNRTEKEQNNMVLNNNITSTHVGAVGIDEFERAIGCVGLERFPNGEIYAELRDMLIGLINDGSIVLHNITPKFFDSLLSSMSDGSERRQITNLRAYCLAAVQNYQKHRQKVNEGYQDKFNRVRAQGLTVLAASENYPRGLRDKKQAEVDWKVILDKLEEEIHALGFDVWIKPLVPVGYYNENIVVIAPSEELRNEVVNRYADQIVAVLKE